MSSCDCTINAFFKVAPSVTLSSALPNFRGFIEAYSLFGGADLNNFPDTETMVEDSSDYIQVQEGYLCFRLSCHSAGQDFEPEGMSELLANLDSLAIDGAAVEIYNHDTPADAESTCMVRFVGATAYFKVLAQVQYGLEQAKTWISPVVGDDGFAVIHQSMLALIASMPGALSAQSIRSDLLSSPNMTFMPAYATGSMAEKAFGNTRAPVIELCDPFEAKDAKGSAWAVTGVYIHAASVIPDVYVNLGRPGAHQAQLADDDVFIDAVMVQLRKAGYTGESFGRCELGMQGDSCVVLEPCKDFYRFAESRGFVRDNSFDDDVGDDDQAADPSLKKQD